MESSLSSFQPSPVEIKEGKVRKIYLRVPLEPEEEQAIQVFRQYCQQNGISLPEWVTGEQRYDLKCMHSMKGNVEKAVEFMNKYAEWLPSLPVPEDEVIGYLRQGLMYISGRSKSYCPVVIVNIRKMIDSKIELDGLLRLNYFVFNWIIDNMLVPGKVETWVIIQDMKDVGVTQIPRHMMQSMSERLSIYFTLRLNKCYTINVPMTVGILWGVAKHFIDKETRKKIFIERKGWEKKLAEFITPENLEVKYGGRQENRVDGYYPFRPV